jgi:predicted lipoprotein
MTSTSQREPEQLAFDHMTDAYLSWQEESRRLAAAFRAWCAAPRGERRDAWAVYRAALDLEEQAAVGYRHHAAHARQYLALSDLTVA